MASATEPFIYRKRQHEWAFLALRVIVVGALIANALAVFMLALSKTELVVINSVVVLVAIGMLLLFIIPNWGKNGEFSFTVSPVWIECRFPNNEGYKLALQDIKALIRVNEQTVHKVTYFLEDHQGEKYRIPGAFNLKPRDVYTALQRLKPDLAVVEKTNY